MGTKITKQQLADKIKGAETILVITNNTPEIGQFSSCIGLASILKEMDKTAVFVHDGETPAHLEFLEKDQFIQNNAESLRDFIISFKKEKVKKFRYASEEDRYDFLLTPALKQVITKDDLEFRKGDFNVDLVISLGVESKSNICEAVSKHKQLLEELPLVNLLDSLQESDLDCDSWQGEECGLGEMIYELSQSLEISKLSDKVANALLTAIIDRTERFKNKKTHSHNMHIAAELLEFGADPQLVANSLDGKLTEAAVSETKEIIKEALGETGEDGGHDTKLVKNKEAAKSKRTKRIYIRAGDLDDSAYSYDSKLDEYKDEPEHTPPQVDVDEEGNLKILPTNQGDQGDSSGQEEEKISEEANTTVPASSLAAQVNTPESSAIDSNSIQDLTHQTTSAGLNSEQNSQYNNNEVSHDYDSNSPATAYNNQDNQDFNQTPTVNQNATQGYSPYVPPLDTSQQSSSNNIAAPNHSYAAHSSGDAQQNSASTGQSSGIEGYDLSSQQSAAQTSATTPTNVNNAGSLGSSQQTTTDSYINSLTSPMPDAQGSINNDYQTTSNAAAPTVDNYLAHQQQSSANANAGAYAPSPATPIAHMSSIPNPTQAAMPVNPTSGPSNVSSAQQPGYSKMETVYNQSSMIDVPTADGKSSSQVSILQTDTNIPATAPPLASMTQ